MNMISSIKEAQEFVKTAEVGSPWLFVGYPDPITDEDPDEYDKDMAKASELEARIVDIIDRALVKEARTNVSSKALAAEAKASK